MFRKRLHSEPPPPPSVKPPEKTYTNVLLITFIKGDYTLRYTLDDWDPAKPARAGWLDFYKWYFGKASDHFVMRYTRGETMIKRENIERFTVEII